MNYGKRISVSIASVGKTFDYPGLNITFSGDFDNDPAPNIYEVQIYNLSQDSISNIIEGSQIVVNAGYDKDIGLVAQGVVHSVKVDKDGVDTVTTIKFGDVPKEWRTKTFSKTYGKGIKSSQIIGDVLGALGSQRGNINLSKDVVYQTGKTVNGKISTILKQLSKETKTDLEIKNMSVGMSSVTKGNETGFVLNSKTGLINTPRRIDDGDNGAEFEIDMLFNYRVGYKSIFKIESKNLDGYFIAIKGTYKDDHTITCEVKRV